MSRKHTARNAAVEALIQVEENEGYSNIVLDKTLREYGLDQRDSGLASTIFYGVLEKRLTLDFYLRSCLKEPHKKIQDTVFLILRAAAYQLLYLDKVPPSAAVNEAVESVKEFGFPFAAGFVNGVLRGLLRKREEISLPSGADAKSLSIRYSIPEELICFWQKSYGDNFVKKLLPAFEGPAPCYIRINSLKTSFPELRRMLSETGGDLEECPKVPHCAILNHCGAPAETVPFQNGLFHIQDLSAQLVCQWLAPLPGEHVCDCCAAPGGKTFTLAQLMGNRGKVTSFDLYKGRVGLIRQGAERLGLSSIEAGVNDALKGFSKTEPAHRVLCDVPCSGYGVIRRKPEIRYKKLQDTAGLPEIQYQILKNAASLVRPGGTLLYSTCTLNPSENEQVADRFLKDNNGFQPMKINLPGTVENAGMGPDHMVTLTPFSGASDGFFAALFRRIP